MLEPLGAGTYGKVGLCHVHKRSLLTFELQVYRVEHKQTGDIAASKVAELTSKVGSVSMEQRYYSHPLC